MIIFFSFFLKPGTTNTVLSGGSGVYLAFFSRNMLGFIVKLCLNRIRNDLAFLSFFFVNEEGESDPVTRIVFRTDGDRLHKIARQR